MLEGGQGWIGLEPLALPSRLQRGGVGGAYPVGPLVLGGSIWRLGEGLRDR